MKRSHETPRPRTQPLRALQAVRRLIADPDDTRQVFEVISALGGPSDERNFRRFRASEVGARVLAEQRDLVETLADREALRALPVGSLGHAYAAFMDREQISADGLVDASIEGSTPEVVAPDPERERFGARLRDSHDLWHVVTGYNRDLIGEAALLAFTYAQTRNRGIGVLVAAAWTQLGRDERPLITQGYRRGRRAAWLPGADWEALLSRPLDTVREQLGVGAPPSYTEVRSDGAPLLAGT